MATNATSNFPHMTVHNAILVTFLNNTYAVLWIDAAGAKSQISEDMGESTLTCIVTDLEGNFIDEDFAPEISYLLESLGSSFRIQQIWQELGVEGPITDSRTIDELVRRSFTDEWMGQTESGNQLTVAELANLLSLDQKANPENAFRKTLEVIDRLEDENKISYHEDYEIIYPPII